MHSIAAGDGPRAVDVSSLAHYYLASGTPPGRFLGRGLAGLDNGKGVIEGTVVEDEHLRRMLHECADPITGEQLAAKKLRSNGVGSFDFTFSPSKSVSVAWALADPATRDVIYRCHQDAISYVLDYAQREVFRVRAGTNGIVVDETNGVVAAAFTHFDSRSGDPQLHDHVVVMNRAQSARDGTWRTLDSRAIFAATVELSELHQGVLADLLCQRLGWDFDARLRRHSPVPKWEVKGVSDGLIAEFSRRSEGIELEKIRLVSRFEEDHGRLPTDVEVLRLRQTATLATRPAKRGHSLASLTEEWTTRAQSHLDTSPTQFVAALSAQRSLLGASDVAPEAIAELARRTLETVSTKRATFSLSNLRAESNRLLQGERFSSPTERECVVRSIADAAAHEAVLLSAPELRSVPDFLRGPNGSSRFTSTNYQLYSSRLILDAENRLLAAAASCTAPTVLSSTLLRVTSDPLPGRAFDLTADQVAATLDIATSGELLDLLSAPAGSGKTTTMAALKAAWEVDHGVGSVLGLAPSAAAAEVLGAELGVETDNVAKFLYEHRLSGQRRRELDSLRREVSQRREQELAPTPRQVAAINQREAQLAKWALSPGQLLIVDEASLAGTFDLDELLSAARDARAKVLLVGDPCQLSSVEAGGMFATLVKSRSDTPTLNTLHRFSEPWEARASLALRSGEDAAYFAYQAHGRLRSGDRDELLEQIFANWSRDLQGGLESIMLAGDAQTVHELNTRARLERVARGEVSGQCPIATGHAGVGDVVVTRENDRRLVTSEGSWVKNGDAWRVEALQEDGSLVLTRTSSGARVSVNARYAAHHLELGYASTLHRAQGRTYARAHCYVTPRTTREQLYVAMTRGRDANLAYVDTGYDVDPMTSHDGLNKSSSMREIFSDILHHAGSPRSATDVIRDSFERQDSLNQLIAEYSTIVNLADPTDWAQLVRDVVRDDDPCITGLAECLVTAAGFDALVATMRNARSCGVDLASVLPRLMKLREFTSASDAATVLDYRLRRWLDVAPCVEPDHRIAGIVPVFVGDASPDVVAALEERRQAIETHCEVVIESAYQDREPWVRELGPVPEGEAATAWRGVAMSVAAYRERWEIDDVERALGEGPLSSTSHRTHHARVLAALASLDGYGNLAPNDDGHASQALGRGPEARQLLGRYASRDHSSWSLATLEDQLHLARDAYRRAQAALGVAALVEEMELRTLRDTVEHLERQVEASPDDVHRETQLNLAHDAYCRGEAALGVTTLTEELELQILRDDAIAAEDAVIDRRHQLDAALGHDVLEGAMMSRDIDSVRSRIAWSDAVLTDRARTASLREFALLRLDVEMRTLTQQIHAATPERARVSRVNLDVVAEERERLRFTLAQRSAEYALVTEVAGDERTVTRVLSDIDIRHSVDTDWLAAQKAAIVALEPEVGRQLRGNRGRAVATAQYASNSLAPLDAAPEAEQIGIHGFGIEPNY
jgi:conjugative relaxase-like TrwC/TraI family protein